MVAILSLVRSAAEAITIYGVDIKQQGTRACVIEVNDNPDIDSGFEAALPGSPVWPALAEWFARRLTGESRFGTERQMDDETPVASVA